MTVEPVVVKPEVDSKKASTNEGIVWLKINGKVPKIENNNQDRDTDKTPSLIFIFMTGAFLEITKKATEIVIVITDDQRKGKGDSSYMCATGRQRRYAIVSINRIVLNILRTTSGLINLILKFPDLEA